LISFYYFYALFSNLSFYDGGSFVLYSVGCLKADSPALYLRLGLANGGPSEYDFDSALERSMMISGGQASRPSRKILRKTNNSDGLG
jgi:hypothetical protein